MRLFLCLLLLSSCCAKTDKASPDQPAATAAYVTNPLDSILGEKILSEQPLTIRPDNFDELIGMPASLLSDSCALYDVRRLDSTTWTMQHRKDYLTSRKFALLLKTNGKKIVSWKALNDYRIGDFVTAPGGFVLISAVHELQRYPATRKGHYIRIFNMDPELNDRWSYIPKPLYGIRADHLRKKGNHYTVAFDVIESSTEVYHVVHVELDENGNYVSGRETAQVNCRDTIHRETIDELFSNRKP